MDVREFVGQIAGFASWSHPEKIKVFGWFLHVHGDLEYFEAKHIRECYDNLSYEAPELNRDLRRLSERKPPELLRDGRGYRLEGKVRSALDAKYGEVQATIAVTKLLADLPAKIPGIDERAFLNEVLKCYKASAFRATVVMAWNLAYDHLLRWLLADPTRVATFNARIPVRYPKKVAFAITKFEDFEDIKESEVIEVCNSAGLLTSGLYRILQEKLGRRNTAGHPSTIEVERYQAEDTIQDLVNNVVLKLT